VLAIMKKTDMLNVETKFVRKDGSVFLAEATPCKYTLGSKTIIHVVIRDITRRKQAEEELIRLSTAIEQIRDTIVIFGIDGIVQYVNPALEKQVQYNRYELIGKDFANLSKGILNKKSIKRYGRQ